MPDQQHPRIDLRILTERPSPRLGHIIQVLFQEFCGICVELTTDRISCSRSSTPFINYTSSSEGLPGGYWIPPVDLLFETGLQARDIRMSESNGRPCFFADPRGDFPFDVFAASFYLISRYEEYLPHRKDAYGRYDPAQSLAFREGFLDLPLVEFWLKDLMQSLDDRYPGMPAWTRTFRFSPTYDIDIAYAYLHRGLFRSIGGLGRSLSTGNFGEVRDRLRVWMGMDPDPFDTYEWLDRVHAEHQLDPVYFFLLAGRRRGYDRNIDPRREALQNLVRRLSEGHGTGLHPSWQSGEDIRLLHAEKNLLESLSGKKIRISRQHYVRMVLPVTYRVLLEAGILEDHSMGYGTLNGFRASVSSPFSWYDLERESGTPLRLHPFCFMDANAFHEQHLSPAAALGELMHYLDVVGKVGGTLSVIWHNSVLGDMPMYRGWKEVYESFLHAVSHPPSVVGR